MNYQKQRRGSGKGIKVSSVDRIGEPYRPNEVSNTSQNEVYYEKEADEDEDSLGSIKLYDLSAINSSFQQSYVPQPVQNRINIRHDVGAPIPLEYRKQRRNVDSVRYTQPEESIKSRLSQPRVVQQTKTAKNMDEFLNKQKPEKKKRHLKVTIQATDDQDVVRVCKSLIKEYSKNEYGPLRRIAMNFLTLQIVIMFLILLFYYMAK